MQCYFLDPSRYDHFMNAQCVRLPTSHIVVINWAVVCAAGPVYNNNR